MRCNSGSGSSFDSGGVPGCGDWSRRSGDFSAYFSTTTTTTSDKNYDYH